MIDIFSYPVGAVLDSLLQDKTTNHNIIFATDAYAGLGDGYGERDYITKEKLITQKAARKNSSLFI